MTAPVDIEELRRLLAKATPMLFLYDNDDTRLTIALRNAAPALLDRIEAQDKRIGELEKELAELQAEHTDAIPVLQFYADPETYFAIGFFHDPPCGEFMEDFSDTGELGFKPGKRARDLFAKYGPAIDSAMSKEE